MTTLFLNEMEAKQIENMVLDLSFMAEFNTYAPGSYRVTGKEKREVTVTNWYELEDYLYGTTPDKPIKINDELSVYMLTQFGGEGEGDTYYYVFAVTDGTSTRTFRVDGYYASYDGVTYDSSALREVAPKQKMITVWE